MPSLKAISASLVGLLSLGSASAIPPVNSEGYLVASTYFAGFHANRGFPVSAMPWNKYTDVKYAFAYVLHVVIGDEG
jgi:chitinase